MHGPMGLSSKSGWMTYSLEFHAAALKEWRKLGETIKEQFKAKLVERLEEPSVPASRLHGASNRYKIKLRASGYRLVYEVRDRELVVLVISVGKRERGKAYSKAARR
jgi:mRNA interferase RelE/StbE